MRRNEARESVGFQEAAQGAKVVDRPILFSGEMVNAIREGRKTQTRRVVKVDGAGRVRIPRAGSYINLSDEGLVWSPVGGMPREPWIDGDARSGGLVACPYGKPGDRLWVRERQRVIEVDCIDSRIRVRYESDGAESGWIDYPARLKGEPIVGKCLSYGGYRESSRLTLEVTSVRVERLQDISEEDALAEGIRSLVGGYVHETPPQTDDGRDISFFLDPERAFEALWDSINAARGYSWESNPYVWVVGFRRVES